jgi:hypothetical protein
VPATTYRNATTGDVVIDCIANSDMSKGPEVPLWECPCAVCTRMDWDCLDDDMKSDYGRLGRYRHEGFPTYWDEQGHALNALPVVQVTPSSGWPESDLVYRGHVYRYVGNLTWQKEQS